MFVTYKKNFHENFCSCWNQNILEFKVVFLYKELKKIISSIKIVGNNIEILIYGLLPTIFSDQIIYYNI